MIITPKKNKKENKKEITHILWAIGHISISTTTLMKYKLDLKKLSKIKLNDEAATVMILGESRISLVISGSQSFPQLTFLPAFLNETL